MRKLNSKDRMRLGLLGLLIVASLVALGVEVADRGRRVASAGVGPSGTHQAERLSGTGRPATKQSTIPEMLASLNSKLTPENFPYMNYGGALLLRAALDDEAHPMSVSDRLDTAVKCGTQLANAGKLDEAIQLYESLIQQVKAEMPDVWKKLGCDLLTFEAVAYLRMGEQQNCCAMNNARSCLLPISGAGIHTKQTGSRKAIACLLEGLRLSPNDMSARWLLNIAYMTVGEYPAKVPARLLIPLNRFGGDIPMAKFTNIAPSIGLDLLGLAGSVIMEDFRGCGLLDLVVSSSRYDGQLRYFRNNGDGSFTERTTEAGFMGEVGGLNMIVTDYNNDGRPDIVVLRGGWWGRAGHYPLSLLRNDGNGHFTDVTIEAGLLTLGPTMTAVAFDYNGDGFLDLFVGYEATNGDPVPCRLFRNTGKGTFVDVTEQCGLHIVRFVKAAVSADFTHSGRPGLYLSCNKQHNILLRNDGPSGPDKSPSAPWKFTDVSHKAGVDLQSSTFSCFFFDYDNDGWPDLFVGGYGGNAGVGDIANDYLGLPTTVVKAKLYRNNRDGTFRDVSWQTHLDKVILAMGLNYGDLDNDGWLDFYAGTGDPDLSTIIPNRMFRNHAGSYFDEVTTTGDFGHLQKGHGIAFGDLNNNGQEDVFLVSGGAYDGDTAHDCLYLNPGSANHWINLTLTGGRSNRIALGAEIQVTVATPHGDRQITKTVSTGGSFGSSPLRQHIGLGDAKAIKQVSVRWPATGVTQTVAPMQMDRFYHIREGDSKATPWQPPVFPLKVPPGTMP